MAARARGLVVPVGVVLISASIGFGWVTGVALGGPARLAPLVGAALIGVGVLLAFRRPRHTPVALTVCSPVGGRWLAMNSPATKVPSHGTGAYGQAWAIDLLHAPDGAPRPTFGDGAHFRRPAEYPAFGQPIFAPADGVVVRATGRRRDHRSRSSWLAYAYLLLEGMIRELAGPGALMGNFVVLRVDGGYVALAHLQRGSLAVRAGDRVVAGQVLARCGNSGNSSEPHLHVQLMDHPRPALAAGLPFAVVGGAPDQTDGLPADGELIEGRPATPR